MSKRALLLCLCLLASVVIGLGGTIAYLTDTDTRVNTFTVGNVNILVEEKFEQNSAINPGETVEKLAWLTNNGTNPAWVWMTVAVPAEIDDYITLEWADGVTASPGVTRTGEDGKTYIVYTAKVEDLLAVGASTDELLTGVTLSGLVDKQDGKYVAVKNGTVTEIDYDLSKLDVIVTGYAVQDTGFTTVDEAYTAYVGQWGEDALIPTTDSGSVKSLVRAKEGVSIQVDADGNVIAIYENAEMTKVVNSSVHPSAGYYPYINIDLPAEYDSAVSTYTKKTSPTGDFSAPALISTLDTDNDKVIDAYITLIPGVNLEAFQEQNRNPFVEYRFDWDNDGNYDQKVVYSVDLLGGGIILK